MNRMIVKSKVGGDGVLRVDVLVGMRDANKEVQITVEPVQDKTEGAASLRACDILASDLVGMWADRADIGDSREFARRLREEGQTRKRQP